MLSFHSAIFWVLLSASIFHLIPKDRWQIRLSIVSLFSFVIVAAFYPAAAVAGVGFAIGAWVIYRLGASHPKIKKFGPLGLFLALAFFSYFDFSVQRDFYSRTIVNFGMSFYVFRLYGAIRMADRLKTQTSFLEFLALTLFFPIFAAGPIAYQDSFRHALNKELDIKLWGHGLLRICAGAFFLYFAAGYVDGILDQYSEDGGDVFNWTDMGAGDAYFVTILKFLHLYFNFTGYTEIAIGSGMFFGFKIPENFNFPLFAHNIQNFWKRWHLSLSNFIVTYLYLPLTIQFRRPKLALFMSFTLVGLWHQISWPYLVWGVGHGAALVLYQAYDRKMSGKRSKLPNLLKNAMFIGGIVVTITYVAYLSNFANQPDLSAAIDYTMALIGFGK